MIRVMMIIRVMMMGGCVWGKSRWWRGQDASQGEIVDLNKTTITHESFLLSSNLLRGVHFAFLASKEVLDLVDFLVDLLVDLHDFCYDF